MLATSYRTAYNEDHEAFRDTVRKVFAEALTPHMDEHEANGIVPRDVWKKMGDAGMLCMTVKEENGGLGLDFGFNCVLTEELSYLGSSAGFTLQNDITANYFERLGNPEQRAKYLPGMVSGDIITAIAMTEPGAGSDLQGIRTTAKKDGAGYVLNGHKAVVIGAPWASHLIVTARTGGERRDRSGVSVFVLPKDTAGITTRDYETVDGRRASEVYFENVAVPAEALIGAEGEGLALIELVTDEAIAALCAEACGAMKVAHAMTVEYSRQRKQFGVPIGSFQVLQHRMVDMYTAYETAVSLTYLATLRLGSDERERKRAVSAAKVGVGQSARLIGQEAVQIHGGNGVTDEYAIGHFFKRLTIFDSEFGNVDHHLKRHVALG
jgi:alkylation response protein AidB-like acyl-CoA dehydrogenase